MSQCARLAILLIFPTLLLGITVPGSAQTRVDNPARALSKNAGRIVNLVEVLRIRDDGETAIFKMPRKLALGPDGSLYFHDFAEGDRIYRYSPEGKLLFKALKSGQGPGECQHASNFFLARRPAPSPSLESAEGHGLRSRRPLQAGDPHGGHARPPFPLPPGRQDLRPPRRDLPFPGDLPGRRDRHALFPLPRSRRISSPGGSSGISPSAMSSRTAAGCVWTCSMRPPEAPYVYVVHADAYGIDQFDLRTGRVERIFSGPTSAAGSYPGRRRPSPPQRRALRCRSTRSCSTSSSFMSSGTGSGPSRRPGHGERGRSHRRYLRRGWPVRRQHPPRFPERWPASRLFQGVAHERGYYFVPEQDEDGLVSIAKYRVLDPDLFRF